MTDNQCVDSDNQLTSPTTKDINHHAVIHFIHKRHHLLPDPYENKTPRSVINDEDEYHLIGMDSNNCQLINHTYSPHLLDLLINSVISLIPFNYIP